MHHRLISAYLDVGTPGALALWRHVGQGLLLGQCFAVDSHNFTLKHELLLGDKYDARISSQERQHDLAFFINIYHKYVQSSSPLAELPHSGGS